MNTPSSNPFADEPLPQAGDRLMSAAHPLNPYAAPATIGAMNTVPPPGIGLWRDGGYLVLHPRAMFPDRCLLTGVETSERYRQNVRWFYPIDFATRTLRVEYGLLPATKAAIFWKRLVAYVIAVAAIAFVVSVHTFVPNLHPATSNQSLWGSIIVFAIALYTGNNVGRVLAFQKVKSSYLWLRGAKAPFLDTLPPWPGSGI